METFGRLLMSAGVISILVGHCGIAFCGFAIGFGRGLRNLVIPCVGFGDAMRRFPMFIWLWGLGLAGVMIGSFFV